MLPAVPRNVPPSPRRWQPQPWEMESPPPSPLRGPNSPPPSSPIFDVDPAVYDSDDVYGLRDGGRVPSEDEDGTVPFCEKCGRLGKRCRWEEMKVPFMDLVDPGLIETVEEIGREAFHAKYSDFQAARWRLAGYEVFYWKCGDDKPQTIPSCVVQGLRSWFPDKWLLYHDGVAQLRHHVEEQHRKRANNLIAEAAVLGRDSSTAAKNVRTLSAASDDASEEAARLQQLAVRKQRSAARASKRAADAMQASEAQATVVRDAHRRLAHARRSAVCAANKAAKASRLAHVFTQAVQTGDLLSGVFHPTVDKVLTGEETKSFHTLKFQH